MRIGETRYRWEFRLLAGRERRRLQHLGGAATRSSRPWTAGVARRPSWSCVRVAEYTFRAQIADRWRRGNVFLLGDAAHLTPPFIGQGMGAGLRDAMNLAWKLAGVRQRTLPDGALDTYEQERKPHARHMIRFALDVGRAMTAGGELGNLAATGRGAAAATDTRDAAQGARLRDSRIAPLRLVHRRPRRRTGWPARCARIR